MGVFNVQVLNTPKKRPRVEHSKTRHFYMYDHRQDWCIIVPVVQLCFIKNNGQRRYKYLVLGRDTFYFAKTL